MRQVHRIRHALDHADAERPDEALELGDGLGVAAEIGGDDQRPARTGEIGQQGVDGLLRQGGGAMGAKSSTARPACAAGSSVSSITSRAPIR